MTDSFAASSQLLPIDLALLERFLYSDETIESSEDAPGTWRHTFTPPGFTMQDVADLFNALPLHSLTYEGCVNITIERRPPRKLRKCAMRRIYQRRQQDWRRRRRRGKVRSNVYSRNTV